MLGWEVTIMVCALLVFIVLMFRLAASRGDTQEARAHEKEMKYLEIYHDRVRPRKGVFGEASPPVGETENGT